MSPRSTSEVRRDGERPRERLRAVGVRNLALREGVEINQSVGQGLRFSARASYTRSNVRDSFWLIVSSLDKQF